jgi:hypothetical protein
VFVRVVHRIGWDLEVVGEAGQVEKANFADRQAALDRAHHLQPEWIEVGEVVPAGDDVPQHHRWTTLRRQPDGSYQASPLNWAGDVRG